ncbi:hypothetical protein BFW41_06215 [Aeromonas hydrophila]|nr:hypothetical protein BFW41_06215 [Aeromonas hydrophila]
MSIETWIKIRDITMHNKFFTSDSILIASGPFPCIIIGHDYNTTIFVLEWSNLTIIIIFNMTKLIPIYCNMTNQMSIGQGVWNT